MNAETKIIFSPGCFDNFEGTQEELDELVQSIQKMFEGKTKEEIESMAQPIDFDLLDDEDLEMLEHISNNSEGRNLQ